MNLTQQRAHMKVYTIPIHINDFLSDTQHLTPAEMGAYWRLILHHYRIGSNGLPPDQHKIRRLAGCSAQLWGKIGDNVLAMFELTPNGYTQSRVLGELSKAVGRSKQARVKSLKRWDSDDAVASPQQCHSNANHKPLNHKPLIHPMDGEDSKIVLDDFFNSSEYKSCVGKVYDEMESLGYGLDYISDFIDKAISSWMSKVGNRETRTSDQWRSRLGAYLQSSLKNMAEKS